MARLGWKRRRDGALVLRLEREELSVLRSFAGDIAEVVSAPPSGDVADRLYPRAYLDPTEETAESDFQSFVHDDLVRSRLAALGAITESIGAATDADASGAVVEVAVDPEQEIQWLTALNDARLVLGTVLGITEEDHDMRYEPDDPRGMYMNLYHFISAVQAELLDVLAADLGTDGHD